MPRSIETFKLNHPEAIAVQLQSHLEAQQAEAAAEKPVKAARTKARAAQVA